ncbi:MAG: hypothetical protein GY832_31720 [Chloroflexi bacterium]|nr:hypothetical protein [Chloroflexota bacterium]
MAKKKIDDKDIPIGRIAKPIANSLIGIHGLRRAYDIGMRIQEMLFSEVQSQIRRHPDEWDAEFKRQILGQPEPDVPDIPAVPVV